MAEEQNNFASFFADVQITFNMDEQLAKVKGQMQEFASKLSASPISVAVNPVLNKKSFAGEGAFELLNKGIPYMGASGSAATDEQIASYVRAREAADAYRASIMQPEREYKANPYAVARNTLGFSQDAEMGAGMGLMGSLGKQFAGFAAVFKVIGDVHQGAVLNQQQAVLRSIIPSQQQYNDTLKNLSDTANLTGNSIVSSTHSFTAFAMAAKNADIPISQASEAFKALNIGIAATGSQAQSFRIISDFMHTIMNTPASSVSMSQIQRTDLGRYLDIPGLLMKTKEFSGAKTVEQLTQEFDKLNKTQQLTAISTALMNADLGAAQASVNTLAGQWQVFNNDLVVLGSNLVSMVSPALTQFLKILEAIAITATYVVQNLSSQKQTIQDYLTNMFSPSNNLSHQTTSDRAKTSSIISNEISTGMAGGLGPKLIADAIIQGFETVAKDLRSQYVGGSAKTSTSTPVNTSVSFNRTF